MDQPKQNLDEQLLELVKKNKKYYEIFESQAKNKIQVILFVGNTGAGKSTLFNYLAGANFAFDKDEYDEDILVVKDQSSKYSFQGNGYQSLTKEPKYFYNEANHHVIIDFPGFQDTNGEIDQLTIQMLFFKIVTNYPTKIIYVSKSSDGELPDRGSGLQDFIKKLFSKQELDSSKFTVLINGYDQGMPEEKVVDRIYKRLKDANIINIFGKIIVVRKFKNDDSIKKEISQEKREQLWQGIINSNQVKFQPNTLAGSQVVSRYIREKTSHFIFQNFDLIFQTFEQKISQLQEGKLEILKYHIDKIKTTLQKMKGPQIINSFRDFSNICQEIFQIFECNNQDQIKSGTENFLEIYMYFLNFSEFIDGFQESENDLDKANNLCPTMINRISQKQQDIIKKREADREKAEKDYQLAQLEKARLAAEAAAAAAEQQKRIAQSQLENQRIQHQLEMERIYHANSIKSVREREREKNKKKKKKKYSTSTYSSKYY